VQPQAATAQSEILAPRLGIVYWIIVFKQNITTLMGPSEGGSWWYAQARRKVRNTPFLAKATSVKNNTIKYGPCPDYHCYLHCEIGKIISLFLPLGFALQVLVEVRDFPLLIVAFVMRET